MAPMQDTPANRITYSAAVTVDKQFDVRMSANRTGVTGNETHRVFTYHNSIPMPSYLIAIAVGDLKFKALDKRVGVITEGCELNKVAWELEELPKYLQMAE